MSDLTAVIDALLWLPRETLDQQGRFIEKQLTVVPRPTSRFWVPKRIELFRSRDNLLGVPIQYGLTLIKREHRVLEDTRTNLRDTVDFGTTSCAGGPGFEYQDVVVDRIVRELEGRSGGTILSASCGTGKSIMTLEIMRRLRAPTVVLVHKTFLMTQWRDFSKQFLGLQDHEIGIIQQDRCEYRGKKLVIAMAQSLTARGTRYPAELFHTFGFLVVDEVHRFGAEVMSECLAMFPARYRLGLSATPRRHDGLDVTFQAHLGRASDHVEGRRVDPFVLRYNLPRLTPTIRGKGGLLQSTMLNNLLGARMFRDPEGRPLGRSESRPNHGSEFRNDILVQEISRALRESTARGHRRKILVLSDRIGHLQALELLLARACPEATIDYVISGRTEEELEAAEAATIILASYDMVKEGWDVKELDTLVLASPRSDIEQAVGRIRRWCDKKPTPLVLDFVDANSCWLRQGQARLEWYQREGLRCLMVDRTRR